RLEALTGGEVDTVSSASGHPFLLRRAQQEWREGEEAKQAAILNALPARVALLDAHGVIISAHEPWKLFAAGNATRTAECGVGRNYLEVCDRMLGHGSNRGEEVGARVRAVLNGEAGSFSFEHSNHLSKGQHWYLMTVTPMAHGRRIGAVVMQTDITERKRTEDALRESSEKFHQLADNITDAFWIRSPDFSVVHYVSPAFETIWGRTVEYLYAHPEQWVDFVFPEDRVRVNAAFLRLAGEARTLDIDYRIVRPNGDIRWVHVRGFQVRDAKDHCIRHIGIVSDITERRQTSEALQASGEEFRALAEAMPQIVWIALPDGRNIYINQQWMDYTGMSIEESLGSGWQNAFHPDDGQRSFDAWQKARATGGIYSVESRLRRADGTYLWWLIRGVPVTNAGGKIQRWFGTCTDINDLKIAELEISVSNRALRIAEEKYRAIFEHSPVGIFQTTPAGRFISANPELARILGFASPDELIRERTDIEQQGYVDPARREVFRRMIHEQGFIKGFEYEVRRKDATKIWVSENTHIVRGASGEPIYYEGSFEDITARKQADAALRASQMRFKALFDQAAVGVAQTAVGTGRFVHVNQRLCQIVGYTAEALAKLSFGAITHPLDVAYSLEKAQQLVAGTMREYSMEKRYVRPDGTEVWANVTVSPMWAAGETPDFFIAIVQDITERKRLDQHFLQAQKMEALGQFSGGVAHDFNNILAAISGYTELARMMPDLSTDVRGYLDSVLLASGRAVDLVRQILTFSRQEPQERHPIQLHAVANESLKLMRATIPTTIDLDSAVAADAPTVLANANQIHQVLMNLGINAWHAMKESPGRLEVRLEKISVDAAMAASQPKLRPGLYARLSVSDTGSGMDASTVARIFEPFFTTKPPGEGTGLGLAVVHGIMDGHDGAVTVYSQPGEGTVFHLYFPAHAGEEPVAVLAAEPPIPRGQGERILVVDDEELLARLGEKSLTALGYHVEVATNAAAALALVRADPERFALVITDQTMPGMTGLALASQLLQIRAGLPIILMTGFSASLTPARVKAEGLRELLLKPTSIQALAAAVRAAITSPSSP
ncbi:MAG TPA: PAS domain S-box protein, partial [Opitutaceae bacterium]|nr:PAS domain S-box protein [Opitutaceae bacterium]